MTPDLKQLQELLAKLAVTQHAHTYASENADIYHAYDSGWQDCVKLMRPAIDALLTHRAALLASHEALSAEVAGLRDASVAMLAKLDQVEKDAAGIFVMAHVHGADYKGANWGDEYKALRAAIDAARQEKKDEPEISERS